MASRMEKYYKADTQIKKRSSKNQDLYRQIYDLGEYSNIEGIAELDSSNEIDISKIKKMLKNRENYHKQKEYRQIITPKEEPVVEQVKDIELDTEEKSYDIRDVLESIKDKKKDEKDYRSLDNTNFNILKELKIKHDQKNNQNPDEGELKELINTITSTSLLNKLDNEELSLKMLDDLESDNENDELVDTNKDVIQSLLEEAKALDAKKREQDKANDIDTSFYTSSLNFDRKDFEDAYDSDPKEKKVKKGIKIVTGIILTIVSLTIIFLIYKFIK